MIATRSLSGRVWSEGFFFPLSFHLSQPDVLATDAIGFSIA
jgi:hypothetical protein